MQDDVLRVGGHSFRSRLIVGTGKCDSLDVMQQALDASGTEIVTVAVRRLELADEPGKTLLDYIDSEKYTILPNTAGCYNAEEAIRTARLAREAGMCDMIKLEVLGDERTLLPDPVETLKATEALV